MPPYALRAGLCLIWCLGAGLLRGPIRTRRFFAYGGILYVSALVGPLALARLQQALSSPNDATAEVPFIGMTAGFVVGPVIALGLGAASMRRTWCYVLNQLLVSAVLLWPGLPLRIF